MQQKVVRNFNCPLRRDSLQNTQNGMEIVDSVGYNEFNTTEALKAPTGPVPSHYTSLCNLSPSAECMQLERRRNHCTETPAWQSSERRTGQRQMQPTQAKADPFPPCRSEYSHHSHLWPTAPHKVAASSAISSNICQDPNQLLNNQGWDTPAPSLPQRRRFAEFFLTPL